MQTNRRAFLTSTAAAMTAATIVPRHVLGEPKHVPPSEKVNIALVGAGGQGRSNVRALFRQADAQVIAVADPITAENLDAFYYKGGPAASANFEYGARLTEIVLFGILSLRTRKKIYWNTDKMEATGLAEADAIIREPSRKGWEIA